MHCMVKMLNPIGLALDTRYGYCMGLRDELILNMMPGRLSGSLARVLAWHVAATAPAGISDDEKHRALAKLCWRLESEGLVAVPYREGLLAVGKSIPWPIPDAPYPLRLPERVSLASPEMGAGMERLLQRILFREARALGYSKYRRTFVKAGGARSAGAEVERIDLARLKINPCLECRQCDSGGTCVHDKDEMAAIYSRIRQVDAIVLASPIFFMGVTAQTKAMIDRCQCFWIERYVMGRRVYEGRRRPRGFSFPALAHQSRLFSSPPSMSSRRSSQR